MAAAGEGDDDDDRADLPPEVRANVLPREIDPGMMLQIQAVFLNRLSGQPKKVGTIYIRIRDREGKEVYPTSPVAVKRSGMVIDISTAGLPPGDYNVQVSNTPYFSPADTVPFKVKGDPLKDEIPPLFQPMKKRDAIRKAPLPPDKEDLAEKVDGEDDVVPVVPLLPEDRATEQLQSGLVRFITELDFKVCAICAVFDQETYRVDDPEKPQIPLHPNCRCHYEYVTGRAS